MITLGIDIGVKAAIAFTSDDYPTQVFDVPTRADPDGQDKHRQRIDGAALLQIFREISRHGAPLRAAYENVRARPSGNSGEHGNTMFSQGSLMQSKGLVLAALDIAGIEHIPIEPQAWKGFYGLIGKKKAESIPKAILMFPELAHLLKRVSIDHNRADALLIANYGHRNVKAVVMAEPARGLF